MGATNIAFMFVAIATVSILYYIVMPLAFDAKNWFVTKTDDARAIAFGHFIYDVVGVFPLIFLGAIFLNTYQKSTRQHSQEYFG